MSTTESDPQAGTGGDLLAGETEALWTAQAPRSLARRYRTLDDSAGWRSWRKHLRQRRNPQPIAELFSGRKSALLWAMPAEPAGAATAELIERLNRLPRRRDDQADPSLTTEVENWLWSCDAAQRSTPWALEALAWAQALPRLAAHLPAPTWWRLLERLLALVKEGARIDTCSDPLLNQLLAGELALTMRYLLPELRACKRLRSEAREALERGVAETLDGEGLPQGTYLGILRPLWACWTRSRAIAGKAAWDRQSQKQYCQFVQEIVRLSRAGGAQVLAEGDSGAFTPKLLQLALRLADEKPLARLAQRMLPGGKRHRAARPRLKQDPSVHSEWAETAVLQPAWQRGGPKLSIVYAQQRTQLELEMAGEVILSGNWETEIRLAGELAQLAGDWEEVCWVSDADGDYLEIEARLTAGITVQRQIFLARKDRCLLLADAVLGSLPGRLEYRSLLPLCEPVAAEPATDTREVWLSGRKARLVAMPLALPEWRIDPRGGQLTAAAGRLGLEQSVAGPRLYAPLFFDLDAKRARKGLTWRQLTVAQDRQIQSADTAVGYRAQAGGSQWVVYRSLAPAGVRTVLGQNLSSEFLFGRFDDGGDVHRLVEIE